MSDVVSVPKKEDVEEEEEDEDLNVPTWHETEKCEDESLRPSETWVKDLLKDFTKVRDSFVSIKNVAERDDLPKRDDENAWYLFCFEGEGHAPLLSIVKSMDTMTRETVFHITSIGLVSRFSGYSICSMDICSSSWDDDP